MKTDINKENKNKDKVKIIIIISLFTFAILKVCWDFGIFDELLGENNNQIVSANSKVSEVAPKPTSNAASKPIGNVAPVKAPPKYDTAVDHNKVIGLFNLVQRVGAEDRPHALAFGAQSITRHEKREQLRLITLDAKIKEQESIIAKMDNDKPSVGAVGGTGTDQLNSLIDSSYVDSEGVTRQVIDGLDVNVPQNDPLAAKHIAIRAIVNGKAYLDIGPRSFTGVKKGHIVAGRYLVDDINNPKDCMKLIDISSKSDMPLPIICLH